MFQRLALRSNRKSGMLSSRITDPLSTWRFWTAGGILRRKNDGLSAPALMWFLKAREDPHAVTELFFDAAY